MRSFFILENVTRQRVIGTRIRSASDSAARRRGLLHAKELADNAGLWINPCEAIHTFGMHIPLDIVFLDATLRVRKIAHHVKPNRIAFCLTAQSVLEMKAGRVAASATECGDQLLLRDHLEASTTVPADGNR